MPFRWRDHFGLTKEKPAVLVPVRVVESRLERDGEPSLLANVLPKPDGIPEASGSRLPLPGKLTQSLTQFPLVSDFITQYQLLTESRPTQNRVSKDVPFESDRGHQIPRIEAGVVELVDARDLKSRSARSAGSIPTARTIEQR